MFISRNVGKSHKLHSAGCVKLAKTDDITKYYKSQYYESATIRCGPEEDSVLDHAFKQLAVSVNCKISAS